MFTSLYPSNLPVVGCLSTVIVVCTGQTSVCNKLLGSGSRGKNLKEKKNLPITDDHESVHTKYENTAMFRLCLILENLQNVEGKCNFFKNFKSKNILN